MKRFEYRRLEIQAPSLYISNETSFYVRLDKELSKLASEGWIVQYSFYEKTLRFQNGVYNFLLYREVGDEEEPEQIEPSDWDERVPQGVTSAGLKNVYTLVEIARVLGISSENRAVQKKRVLELEQQGLVIRDVNGDATQLGLPPKTRRYVAGDDFRRFLLEHHPDKLYALEGKSSIEDEAPQSLYPDGDES